MTRQVAWRLKDRRGVKRLIQRGRRFRSVLGLVSWLPSPVRRGQLLFIVSSKVSKKSTVRNRLRRRLHEWARQSKIVEGLGKDAVILVGPGAAALSPARLRQGAAETLADLKHH